MMYTMKPLADEYDMDICVGENGDLTVEEMDASASACFGISAVLRMTFALVIFHLLMLILIFPRNECASVIHDGGWFFKVIIITALYIGFFWLPMSFLKAWAEISRYVSIIFLVL